MLVVYVSGVENNEKNHYLYFFQFLLPIIVFVKNLNNDDFLEKERRKQELKKEANKVVAVVLAIIVVFSIIITFSGVSEMNANEKRSYNVTSANQTGTTPEDTSKPSSANAASSIAVEIDSSLPVWEKFGFTAEQWPEVDAIFKACGFTEILRVEIENDFDTSVDTYYVEMKNVEPNVIVAPGKTTGNIIYIDISTDVSDRRIVEILVNFHSIYKEGKVLSSIWPYIR